MHSPRPTAVIGSAILLAIAPITAGCASRSDAPATGPDVSPRWTDLAPGLRFDPEARLLEFDASVAIDCHDPDTPDVYLELVACTPDTREHESLVVTDVPPSLIHAGLLAIGLQHGTPGRAGPNATTPPTGDPLRITVTASDGQGRLVEVSPVTWITDAETRSRTPADSWTFAGSTLETFRGETVYDADLSGTLVGLATFGTETIAWRSVFSPESAIDAPTWIADSRTVPVRGTPVRVRVSPASTEEPASSEEPQAE